MWYKGKRLLLTTLAAGLLYTTTAFAANVQMDLFYNGAHHAYNAKEIAIVIDGESYTDPNMPAVSIDGRTMLPMRGICEELGCTVTWNEAARQVYAVSDTHTVVFQIDSKTGYKNGETFTMDVAPMIINDRTMLPVRALATALDIDVTWDDPNRTVYIGEAPSTGGSTDGSTGSNTGTNTGGSTGSNTGGSTGTNTGTSTATTGKVSSVTVPTSKTATQNFVITTTGTFNRCEEVYVSDNKVVLDFYGATNGLSANITATNSPFVTAIRTAQHTADNGETYTRVVFDLTGKMEYKVTPNAAKNQVTLAFEQVEIKSITSSHSGSTETVTINASGATGATVTTMQDPYRTVIDMPGVKADDIDEIINTDGLEYVSEVRTGWMNGTAFRVVVEANDLTQMTWKEENGKLTVTIQKSTLENLSYDDSTDTLTLKKVETINTGSIKHNDAYLDGYYELTLPGDYSDVYGYGTLNVNTDQIKSFTISTTGGNTVIRFNQNIISAYTIKDTGSAYEITAKNPQQVYDKVLLLDAGHGGNDPGTSGNGLTEKTMNLTMVLKVKSYVESNSNIKVYLTRDDDSRPANADRAKTANQIADLMVSIHMNAGTASASGTETLYAAHSNDGNGTLTSLQAAQAVQSRLPSALSTTNRGVKSRPDLLILNSTTVPAILIETCFLSNPGDALKISQATYQDAAAKAIGDGIIYAMSNYKLR